MTNRSIRLTTASTDHPSTFIITIGNLGRPGYYSNINSVSEVGLYCSDINDIESNKYSELTIANTGYIKISIFPNEMALISIKLLELKTRKLIFEMFNMSALEPEMVVKDHNTYDPWLAFAPGYPKLAVREIILDNCDDIYGFMKYLLYVDPANSLIYYNKNDLKRLTIRDIKPGFTIVARIELYMRDNYKLLEFNYPVDPPVCDSFTPSSVSDKTLTDKLKARLKEFDDNLIQINKYVKRNNYMHRSSVDVCITIFAIKRYRKSVFDLIGKDIVRIIINLVLDTKYDPL